MSFSKLFFSVFKNRSKFDVSNIAILFSEISDSFIILGVPYFPYGKTPF